MITFTFWRGWNYEKECTESILFMHGSIPCPIVCAGLPPLLQMARGLCCFTCFFSLLLYPQGVFHCSDKLGKMAGNYRSGSHPVYWGLRSLASRSLQHCDVSFLVCFLGFCCFSLHKVVWDPPDLDSSPNSQVHLVFDLCQAISFYMFKWQSYPLRSPENCIDYLCFCLLHIEVLRAVPSCVPFLS